MDSNCRKLGETPYRACRKQAAIYNDALGSMERAAEMLGVSVNTLSNYELGVTVPPVDIIIVMADLYRAPQLKTMYCKNECLIGRSCRMKRQKGTGLSRRTLILCEDSLKLLANGYSTRSVFSMELS